GGGFRLGQTRLQCRQFGVQTLLLAAQLRRLGEQAFVVAVQAGQLVLLDHQALLGLAQLHLHLLQLALVAALVLLALFAAGLAVCSSASRACWCFSSRERICASRSSRRA